MAAAKMAATAAAAERTETLLRCACVVAAAAAALLLGLSAQTKTVLFIRKKAMAKDVEALWVLVVASAAAAAYHAARLLKRLCFGRFGADANAAGTRRSQRRAAAWISFLLDKGCAYLVFASSVAALQACFVALTGVESLQWSKLCNIYTRFCETAAAGMVCGLAAAGGMAVLSVFSARDLFRLYSRRPAGHTTSHGTAQHAPPPPPAALSSSS